VRLAEKVRILTYHRVGVPRSGLPYEALTVRADRFRCQMKTLRRLGCTVVDMDAVAGWLDGGNLPGKRATVITFDDGYDDLYEHALPAMQAADVTGLIYLVSDRRNDDWRREKSPDPLALLDWPRIREMAEAGIRFGCHTRTHARLTECSDEQLKDEIGNSKKILEDKLGCAVEHFCYPFGAYNDRVVDAVAEAGYATATTTERGAALRGAHPLRLPRLTIGKRMNLGRFLWRVMVRS
jgi:peptidoglycan/xylan/chitin deacetylase (PgdA/CDA1 family)